MPAHGGLLRWVGGGRKAASGRLWLLPLSLRGRDRGGCVAVFQAFGGFVIASACGLAYNLISLCRVCKRVCASVAASVKSCLFSFFYRGDPEMSQLFANQTNGCGRRPRWGCRRISVV